MLTEIIHSHLSNNPLLLQSQWAHMFMYMETHAHTGTCFVRKNGLFITKLKKKCLVIKKHISDLKPFITCNKLLL